MNLKQLRVARNLRQDDVAAYLRIPTKTYQNYEREVREPSAETMCELAEYYGVSMDDLYGRKDERASREHELLAIFRSLTDEEQEKLLILADNTAKNKDAKILIGSRIALARKLNGLSQDQVADAICVHKQTISRWESGKRTPNGEEVRMLAELLNCSADFILGLSDTLTI